MSARAYHGWSIHPSSDECRPVNESVNSFYEVALRDVWETYLEVMLEAADLQIRRTLQSIVHEMSSMDNSVTVYRVPGCNSPFATKVLDEYTKAVSCTGGFKLIRLTACRAGVCGYMRQILKSLLYMGASALSTDSTGSDTDFSEDQACSMTRTLSDPNILNSWSLLRQNPSCTVLIVSDSLRSSGSDLHELLRVLKQVNTQNECFRFGVLIDDSFCSSDSAEVNCESLGSFNLQCKEIIKVGELAEVSSRMLRDGFAIRGYGFQCDMPSLLHADARFLEDILKSSLASLRAYFFSNQLSFLFRNALDKNSLIDLVKAVGIPTTEIKGAAADFGHQFEVPRGRNATLEEFAEKFLIERAKLSQVSLRRLAEIAATDHIAV